MPAVKNAEEGQCVDGYERHGTSWPRPLEGFATGGQSLIRPAVATVGALLRCLVRLASAGGHPLSLGEHSFRWSQAHDTAFHKLKLALTSGDNTVAHFDAVLPVHVFCDASLVAVGALLAQPDPRTGVLQVVACYSKMLTGCQRRYSVGDRETLTIVAALHAHHRWILGHARCV